MKTPVLLTASLLALLVATPALAQKGSSSRKPRSSSAEAPTVRYRQFGMNIDHASFKGSNGVDGTSVNMLALYTDFGWQINLGSLRTGLLAGFSIGGGFTNNKKIDQYQVGYTGHLDARYGVELPFGPINTGIFGGYGTHALDGDTPQIAATGPLVEGRLNVGPFRTSARIIAGKEHNYLGLTGLYQLPDSVPLIGNTNVGLRLDQLGDATIFGFTFRAVL